MGARGDNLPMRQAPREPGGGTIGISSGSGSGGSGGSPDHRTGRSRLLRLFAPTWFLIGVVVGASGFAAFTLIRSDSNTATVRGAARKGTLDALTSYAKRAQAASAAPAAPAAPRRAAISFTTRDADRVGEKSAPVTIVEFGDFQCPYCRRFFETTEPSLLNGYVKAGKVRFVFKHYAFLGVESVWAAEAAECAANQSKFWPYHNLLFNRQGRENGGAFTKRKLEGFAQGLGLEMSRFKPCLENGQTLSRVQADRQEGERAGVNGTPTLFVNGQASVGAASYQTLRVAIDQILKSS